MSGDAVEQLSVECCSMSIRPISQPLSLPPPSSSSKQQQRATVSRPTSGSCPGLSSLSQLSQEVAATGGTLPTSPITSSFSSTSERRGVKLDQRRRSTASIQSSIGSLSFPEEERVSGASRRGSRIHSPEFYKSLKMRWQPESSTASTQPDSTLCDDAEPTLPPVESSKPLDADLESTRLHPEITSVLSALNALHSSHRESQAMSDDMSSQSASTHGGRPWMDMRSDDGMNRSHRPDSARSSASSFYEDEGSVKSDQGSQDVVGTHSDSLRFQSSCRPLTMRGGESCHSRPRNSCDSSDYPLPSPTVPDFIAPSLLALDPRLHRQSNDRSSIASSRRSRSSSTKEVVDEWMSKMDEVEQAWAGVDKTPSQRSSKVGAREQKWSRPPSSLSRSSQQPAESKSRASKVDSRLDVVWASFTDEAEASFGESSGIKPDITPDIASPIKHSAPVNVEVTKLALRPFHIRPPENKQRTPTRSSQTSFQSPPTLMPLFSRIATRTDSMVNIDSELGLDLVDNFPAPPSTRSRASSSVCATAAQMGKTLSFTPPGLTRQARPAFNPPVVSPLKSLRTLPYNSSPGQGFSSPLSHATLTPPSARSPPRSASPVKIMDSPIKNGPSFANRLPHSTRSPAPAPLCLKGKKKTPLRKAPLSPTPLSARGLRTQYDTENGSTTTLVPSLSPSSGMGIPAKRPALIMRPPTRSASLVPRGKLSSLSSETLVPDQPPPVKPLHISSSTLPLSPIDSHPPPRELRGEWRSTTLSDSSSSMISGITSRRSFEEDCSFEMYESRTSDGTTSTTSRSSVGGGGGDEDGGTPMTPWTPFDGMVFEETSSKALTWGIQLDHDHQDQDDVRDVYDVLQSTSSQDQSEGIVESSGQVVDEGWVSWGMAV